MKILILASILRFSDYDTLKMEYNNSGDLKEWKNGYIVTTLRKREDLFVYFDEPSAFLDSKKNPIDRPRKYTVKF